MFSESQRTFILCRMVTDEKIGEGENPGRTRTKGIGGIYEDRRISHQKHTEGVPQQEALAVLRGLRACAPCASNGLHQAAEVHPRHAFREFNFRACGIAYDNVLSAGMKPFVELSFMPRELAEDPEKTGSFYYRPIDCMPKDLTAWRDYIQRFIRFLEHRYGEAEVRTWYFEVWNEPDLNPVFFQGTRDDYFRLYEATARAIKEVDPHLSVGGPATSGSKWVKSFRNFCEEKNVPLDFISTHQYAGDPLGHEGACRRRRGLPQVSGEHGRCAAGTPGWDLPGWFPCHDAGQVGDHGHPE